MRYSELYVTSVIYAGLKAAVHAQMRATPKVLEFELSTVKSEVMADSAVSSKLAKASLDERSSALDWEQMKKKLSEDFGPMAEGSEAFVSEDKYQKIINCLDRLVESSEKGTYSRSLSIFSDYGSMVDATLDIVKGRSKAKSTYSDEVESIFFPRRVTEEMGKLAAAEFTKILADAKVELPETIAAGIYATRSLVSSKDFKVEQRTDIGEMDFAILQIELGLDRFEKLLVLAEQGLDVSNLRNLFIDSTSDDMRVRDSVLILKEILDNVKLKDLKKNPKRLRSIISAANSSGGLAKILGKFKGSIYGVRQTTRCVRGLKRISEIKVPKTRIKGVGNKI